MTKTQIAAITVILPTLLFVSLLAGLATLMFVPGVEFVADGTLADKLAGTVTTDDQLDLLWPTLVTLVVMLGGLVLTSKAYDL